MKQKIVTDMTILKTKSSPATPDEVQAILQDLTDTLDLKRGLGLSAIQIGINRKISIVRVGETKIDLINAEILEKDEKFVFKDEGCLSLAGIKITTDRYNYIKIYNNGKIEEYRGLLAVCIQHEIDHENALTIINRKHRARY